MFHFFFNNPLGSYRNDLWRYPLPILPASSSTIDEIDSNQNNSALIGGLIGGILGFLLLISISILIIFFVRKRKKRNASNLENSVELSTLYASITPRFASSYSPSPSSYSVEMVSSGKREWEIPYNELKIEGRIGQGSFGVVYKVSEVKEKD